MTRPRNPVCGEQQTLLFQETVGAYDPIREQAMNKRVTTDAIVNANEILSFGK